MDNILQSFPTAAGNISKTKDSCISLMVPSCTGSFPEHVKLFPYF